MIPALFLISAMALRPVAFTHGHPLTKPESLASLLKVSRKALVVDGDAQYVRELRNAGVKAFGATLWWEHGNTSPWSVYTKFHQVPFAKEAFQLTLWIYPPMGSQEFLVHWAHWMMEAARLTEVGGFLVFQEDHYVRWGNMLQSFGWEKLPFQIDQMSIYQKPMKKRIQESA